MQGWRGHHGSFRKGGGVRWPQLPPATGADFDFPVSTRSRISIFPCQNLKIIIIDAAAWKLETRNSTRSRRLYIRALAPVSSSGFPWASSLELRPSAVKNPSQMSWSNRRPHTLSHPHNHNCTSPMADSSPGSKSWPAFLCS